MPIKLKRVYLNNWLSAGQHVYQTKGDFYQLTNLYPTLDRQQLRRAPAFSGHLTHSDLDTVEGMFFDRANVRYVLIGQDASDQLACTYFTSAWSAVGAAYVLDAAVSVMDGFSMRNFCYAHGYLWMVSNNELARTDDYVTTPTSQFNSLDGELVTYLGGRIYMAQDDGRLYRMLTDGSDIENHFNPADDLVMLYMTGLKDDLIIVAAIMNGEIRVFRTVAYAKTAIRKLEDMAVLPGDTAEYPTAGCPFAVHDNDLYLLSGSMPNPDATETRDLLAYTGYRIERIARLDDVDAAALALGLFTWRGELIYYELAAASATFKMLVGNAFVDFATVASYSGSGMAPIAANLGGNIVVTGLVGANEGIYHAGSAALADGNVETAWLDGGLPGVRKRLIATTLAVKNATANTTKTLSYMKDTQTSYTQIGTETDITPMLLNESLGIEFYRIRFKAAIADTSNTQDVRITGIDYTYAVGDD